MKIRFVKNLPQTRVCKQAKALQKRRFVLALVCRTCDKSIFSDVSFASR